MPEVDVNNMAVIVAAIVYFVVGAIWYSPALFGNMWMKHMKIKKEDAKGMPTAYVLGFIAALVTSWVLALVVGMTEAATFSEGLMAGFWMWLGFVVTTHLSHVLWGKLPPPLYYVFVAYNLVALGLAGGILAVWA